MSTYHGKNCHFVIADNGGTERDISGDLQSSNITFDIPTEEDTGFKDADKTFLVGIKGYNMSIDGNWSDTSNVGTDVVFSDLLGASQRFFRFAPGGSATGQRSYTGSVIMTSYNVTTPVGGKVGFSANFIGNGAMTASTM